MDKIAPYKILIEESFSEQTRFYYIWGIIISFTDFWLCLYKRVHHKPVRNRQKNRYALP